MDYKEKVIQGVKCCINKKAKCYECPFYNDGHTQCDELRQEILQMFVSESYQYVDWSGFQGGL